MSNMWLLTKISLLGAFGINRFFYTKDGAERRKRGLFFLGVIAVGLLFIMYSCTYSFGVFIALESVGRGELLISSMAAFASFVCFIMTVYRVNGLLFGLKDHDLLLSMPVTVGQVIGSRVITLYARNLLPNLIFLLPAGIIYGTKTSAGALFYAFFIIGAFLTPLIPIVIASIVGYVTSAISARFKRSNIVNIILGFVLVLGIMVFSMTLSSRKVSDIAGSLETGLRIYPPAAWLQAACVKLDVFAMLLFAAVSIGIFVLFLLLSAPHFEAINERLAAVHAPKRAEKPERVVARGALEALYRREMKRFSASALYVLNTSFGMVLFTLFAVAIAVLGPEKLETTLNTPGLSSILPVYLPLVVSACVGLSNTACCSVSLEGKSLWIVRSMPVSERTIFISKILVNLTITVPAALFGALIMAVSLSLSFTQVVLVILMPVAFAFLAAILGITVNLEFPNVDWTSEITVIKQSAATLIAVFSGFGLVALPGYLMTVPAFGGPVFVFALVTVLYALAAFALWRRLLRRGVLLFRGI